MNKPINKIIISIALLFIFAGCIKRGNIKHREEEKIIEGIDFTWYSKKGFLITAGDYGEDFESIGMFTFTIYPASHRIEKENTIIDEKIDGSRDEEIVKTYIWKQEKPNLQKLFDFIYQEALSKKADGIINLRVDFVAKTFMDGDYVESILGIKVDGFLIKRVRASE